MSSLLPAIPAGATLYQRAVTNAIGVTAATSNNIGYLGTNRTQLEVAGQLTAQNPTDMYNFTFQNNAAVKLGVTNIDGATTVRVQLMDGSGSRVIADNQGSADQKQVYAKLTSPIGFDLTNGKYVLKVTYGTGGDKSKKQDYALQIGSGHTFTADYRTLASAQTIQNTLLAGGNLGYNSLSATASFLTSQANGTSVDLFGILGQVSNTRFFV